MLEKKISFKDSLSHIKIRCPQCFKPFLVKEKVITQDEPQFACNQCDTHFWIPYKESKGLDEFLGIKLKMGHLDIQENEIETKKESFKFKGDRACPKCSGVNSFNQKECSHCGVIISKYELISKEDHPHVPVHLLESWQNVIKDYDNDVLHRSFLNKCQKLSQLDYASMKYAKILGIYGGDQKALDYKKKIVALVQAESGVTKKESPAHAQPVKPHKRNLFQNVLFAIVGVGIVLFTVGKLSSEFRNLMGLGVSLVFISGVLLIYTRR